MWFQIFSLVCSGVDALVGPGVMVGSQGLTRGIMKRTEENSPSRRWKRNTWHWAERVLFGGFI